ncbi:MAG: HAMP domain-containing histidine kinase [Alphaproteobacteria bacterium]|nr:HAMP domain-containing histidine kinase [Alphaproteobacteria bacterium]MCB9699553.1 HAMP domain-containing histidine kinase [Alphaproteobacteria bacterium]
METARISALKSALWLALAYGASAAVYILISSRVAGALVQSQEALTRVEELKGIAFVVVTSLALFAVSYGLLRRRDALAERVIQQQAALAMAEQRALVGVMAAAIGHDINNYLSVLHLVHETLRDERTTDSALLDEAGRATLRLAELSRGLRDAAHPEQSPAQEADLAQVVEEALAVVRKHPEVVGREIRFEGGVSVILPLRSALIHQIVWNLVLNAAQVQAGSQAPLIEVRVGAAPGGGWLEVHDAGPGLSEALREKVLAGLFTTRAGGSGLGLLSVRSCAAAHGGVLSLEASPLGGLLARVDLPAT